MQKNDIRVMIYDTDSGNTLIDVQVSRSTAREIEALLERSLVVHKAERTVMPPRKRTDKVKVALS